uniref:Uncharacterized protein n=1 Tax=Rhizophora mucronata TaxID=61149 RepID=A0A2P2NKQ8_RHIMU
MVESSMVVFSTTEHLARIGIQYWFFVSFALLSRVFF